MSLNKAYIQVEFSNLYERMTFNLKESEISGSQNGGFKLNAKNDYPNVLNVKTRVLEIEVITQITVFLLYLLMLLVPVMKMDASSSLQQKYQRKYCI